MNDNYDGFFSIKMQIEKNLSKELVNNNKKTIEDDLKEKYGCDFIVKTKNKITPILNGDCADLVIMKTTTDENDICLDIDDIIAKYEIKNVKLIGITANSFYTKKECCYFHFIDCNFKKLYILSPVYNLTRCKIDVLDTCSEFNYNNYIVSISDSDIKESVVIINCNQLNNKISIENSKISSLTLLGERIELNIDNSKIKKGVFSKAQFNDIYIEKTSLNYDCLKVISDSNVHFSKSVLNGLFFKFPSARGKISSFVLKNCILKIFGKIPDTESLSVVGKYKDFTFEGLNSLRYLYVKKSNIKNDRIYQTLSQAEFIKSPNFTKNFILNKNTNIIYDDCYPLGYFGKKETTTYYCSNVVLGDLYIDNSETLILYNVKAKSLVVKKCKLVEFNKCKIDTITCDDFYAFDSEFKNVVSSKKKKLHVCEKCSHNFVYDGYPFGDNEDELQELKRTKRVKVKSYKSICNQSGRDKHFFEQTSLPYNCPFKFEHSVELT